MPHFVWLLTHLPEGLVLTILSQIDQEYRNGDTRESQTSQVHNGELSPTKLMQGHYQESPCQKTFVERGHAMYCFVEDQRILQSLEGDHQAYQEGQDVQLWPYRFLRVVKHMRK